MPQWLMRFISVRVPTCARAAHLIAQVSRRESPRPGSRGLLTRLEQPADRATGAREPVGDRVPGVLERVGHRVPGRAAGLLDLLLVMAGGVPRLPDLPPGGLER